MIEQLSSEQVNPMNRNPQGKGGFQDHPELRNSGGRPKNDESFTYWMRVFKNMTVNEFLAWEKENPMDDRTVAASIAYIRVGKARADLAEFKEVADRTEGKSIQRVDATTNGKDINPPNTGEIAAAVNAILNAKSEANPSDPEAG